MSDDRYREARALNGVARFHELFQAPVLDAPEIPSADRCALRIKLLQEELDELRESIEDQDIVEVADALADLQYVLSGAVHEFGLGDRFARLFAEVQRSNMSKACATHEEAQRTVDAYRAKDGTEGYIVERDGEFVVYRRGDDKVLKSVNYSPADLRSILDAED